METERGIKLSRWAVAVRQRLHFIPAKVQRRDEKTREETEFTLSGLDAGRKKHISRYSEHHEYLPVVLEIERQPAANVHAQSTVKWQMKTGLG